MVLRAVKLVIQATLLLQVLQGSISVNGLEVSENFQNTKLTSKDQPGTVAPADISDSDDDKIRDQEERGFWSWMTGNDDKEKAPASAPAADAPASEGDLATTTPIPGTSFTRPSTSSFMSKFGSTLGDFTDSDGSGDGSTAGAGSDATPAPKKKKTKKPVVATTSDSASESASGSDATPTTKKPTRRTKKPVVAAASGSEDSASGSEATTPATRKPRAKRTKKPVVAADSESASDDASGSEATTPATRKPKAKRTKKPVVAAASASEDASGSLDELLTGSATSGSEDLSALLATSGSEDLSALLGSSAGSGSEDDLSALLGSSGASGSGDGGLAALLGGSLTKGSGSMLSFEDFLKEYGSMFGSGSSGLDLFGGDPTQPMNNTINDDDIILGEVYGGKEHGDAFSDIKNIKFGQMILNITVRGQERVDQVGLMVMTQEAVGNLVHGGKGGTEGFIEPQMGDTIDSVEVHWDKNKGKTCIFYLKMTTSGKKTIATGTKTANTAVITPPKGYQLAGFHGRASSSGIFCIGGIFTKTSATDLTVTDVMAISSAGSEDIYNYKTTIRNWVGPLETASDNACYQKKFDVSSKGVCPSGFNKDDDKCVTQCPLNYPVDCLMECIPQNSDCTQEIISKVAS
ncbi:Haustorium-specific membrane protein, partial [Phytophthora palmivora]